MPVFRFHEWMKVHEESRGSTTSPGRVKIFILVVMVDAFILEVLDLLICNPADTAMEFVF